MPTLLGLGAILQLTDVVCCGWIKYPSQKIYGTKNWNINVFNLLCSFN